MKKFVFVALFIFLLSPLSIAADNFFDSYTGIDRIWDGQKPVTNTEFEEAINTLTEKQKKKEAKAQKKKIKKVSGGGTSLHKGLDPLSEIAGQDSLKEKGKDEGQLLNIPVNVIIDGNVLEKGFYNVFGEKDKKGDIYLSFYQSHYFKGKVKAYDTKDDFEAENIDFVKLIPYNENYIKVMFGSLDFNAYTYLKYISEQQ